MSEYCPTCLGFGFTFTAGFISVDVCGLCNGTGHADVEQFYVEYGKKLKARREKMKLTVREASEKFGIDYSNLSKMERGILRPQPYYLRGKNEPGERTGKRNGKNLKTG